MILVHSLQSFCPNLAIFHLAASCSSSPTFLSWLRSPHFAARQKRKPTSDKNFVNYVLEAADIHKSFPDLDILQGVSLQVKKGETVAIMGKSGEGKSTLLHILGTLDSPTRGTIRICEKKPEATSVAKVRNQHIGFIFQAYHLLEDFTVLENILMPLKIGRVASLDAHKHASTLLQSVGLKGKEEVLAKFLSGGEKQRVAIARALIHKPDLILADEPTGNLDQMHSLEIQRLLLSMAKESSTALIVVTHDEEFAHQCDRLLFLKEGQLYNPKQ